MPPDVNGLPPPTTSPSFGRRSPHSRRTSQMAARDEEGLPMRHPRPLTAAELHLELEQEQEAVVNRLTRELSALRAQHSASTASNTSSTTNSTSAILETPTSSTRPPTTSSSPARHRSSSSLSTRSQHTGQQQQPLHPQSAAAGISSRASVERARDAAGMRSRENSLASGTGAGSGGVTMPAPSRSRAPSASPSPSLHFGEMAYFSGRDGRQRRGSNASVSTGRYDEAERMRVQLEQSRRENEMLAVRVRELEGLLRESELRGRGRSGRVGGEGEEKG